MTAYRNRCTNGAHFATPRAVVLAGDTAWIQWLTLDERALITSSHRIGSPEIAHVCWCLLGEHRPAGTVLPGDLLGHVCEINVMSYRVITITAAPDQGAASIPDDPLHGVYLPVDNKVDALRWQKLDLPPSARRGIEAAVWASMPRPEPGKPAEGRPVGEEPTPESGRY